MLCEDCHPGPAMMLRFKIVRSRLWLSTSQRVAPVPQGAGTGATAVQLTEFLQNEVRALLGTDAAIFLPSAGLTFPWLTDQPTPAHVAPDHRQQTRRAFDRDQQQQKVLKR
jgi:hypothetical protein